MRKHPDLNEDSALRDDEGAGRRPLTPVRLPAMPTHRQMPDQRTAHHFANAPQSVTTLLASFLEPTLSVAVELLALAWVGERVGRPDLTLCAAKSTA